MLPSMKLRLMSPKWVRVLNGHKAKKILFLKMLKRPLLISFDRTWQMLFSKIWLEVEPS